MEKKIVDRLFIIAMLGLSLAGLVFLCLSMFTDTDKTTYLCIALVSIFLANLFNLIRGIYDRKKDKQSK